MLNSPDKTTPVSIVGKKIIFPKDMPIAEICAFVNRPDVRTKKLLLGKPNCPVTKVQLVAYDIAERVRKLRGKIDSFKLKDMITKNPVVSLRLHPCEITHIREELEKSQKDMKMTMKKDGYHISYKDLKKQKPVAKKKIDGNNITTPAPTKKTDGRKHSSKYLINDTKRMLELGTRLRALFDTFGPNEVRWVDLSEAINKSDIDPDRVLRYGQGATRFLKVWGKYSGLARTVINGSVAMIYSVKTNKFDENKHTPVKFTRRASIINTPPEPDTPTIPLMDAVGKFLTGKIEVPEGVSVQEHVKIIQELRNTYMVKCAQAIKL